MSDKIIIDLSNQLCDGKKVQEKHNKLNCVDYEAGIVQTLMLTCSRNFSISPLSVSQSPGFVVAGGRGMWGHGVMQHGEAELRITEEMPPVTISLHSPVSEPGAIFTSHITHSESAYCETEENRGNVTPWSDLIWINSPPHSFTQQLGDMNVSRRGIA